MMERTNKRSSTSSARLREWLGDVPLDEFRRLHLRLLPLARPGTAFETASRMTWDDAGRVLEAERPAPDVLVVRRGRLLPEPPPRSGHEMQRLLAEGQSLCLRRTERCHAAMAEIAADLGVLGAAHVQLFVTPKGTYGFGWHYDDEDVFVVQTAGVKDYYFRANTVATDRASAAAFRRFEQESSPLCSATLVPGDFLYLPRRWWHVAVAREDSLSISVGVALAEEPRLENVPHL